jgi:dienelactone hydrolase
MSLHHHRRLVPLALALLLLVAVPALAAPVHALFDPSSPASGPFPSDAFTVADPDNLTGVRVSLPRPDCAIRPSDCADLDVINTLDGFNLQPRLSIPFSGAIDPSSVNSGNVFLVSLGDATGGHGGHVVGINQVVWDVATSTLHAESDELLDQHTRYLLVVTDGVRDASGHRVRAAETFSTFVGDDDRDRHHPGLPAYRRALRRALQRLDVDMAGEVVTASLFTTQSATAVLERIRDRIKATTPAPATILATFPRGNVAAIQWQRQVFTNGSVSTSFVPVPALDVFPGAVGTLVFGTFVSPDWETPAKFIPAIGTRTGVPAVQHLNTLSFNLILPAGSPPAGGWPVVIVGHGFTDSKQGAPFAVASTLAAHGLATIAINVVGHGGGGDTGQLVIIPNVGAPVAIPDGGRGIDQNGDGSIDSTEGVNAVPPQGIISSRDGLRQTVADLMQLVRVLETGGVPGVDGARIYYAGQSFGGIYGVKFLALEPSVRAGVANVPGGPIIEIVRISPVFRGLLGLGLAARVPPLLNAPPLAPPLWGFDENIPLRDLPPVVNTVAGAMAIQEVIENTAWVSQAGNPVAYAPHLRKIPLEGVVTRPVIIQFAKGDQTVPNPTATAIFRAGDLADRSTYFRNDLVRAARPTAPANPHTFLTNIGNPVVADLAIAAQTQIAIFLLTDGAVVIDPDGPGPFFEVPIAGPLPETTNF